MSMPLTVTGKENEYKPCGFQPHNAMALWFHLLNKETYKAWPPKEEMLQEWQPQIPLLFEKLTAQTEGYNMPAFNSNPRTLMKIIRP